MSTQVGQLAESRTATLARVSGLNWTWSFCRRKPLGGIGLIIIVIIALVAIFGPFIAPRDPLEINASHLFGGPELIKGNYLGTDHLGRDVLSRIIGGARVSFFTALISVFSGSAIGVLLGLVSGYYSGWIDAVIQRIVDMKMSIPMLVLALAIMAVLGQKTQNVIIAIALIQIPQTARVVRSVVVSVKTMEFVESARALGASDLRILFRHIAPQTFAPIIIVVTAAMGLAIIIEASLSFLGLGTPPPNPSWGSMLSGPTLQNVERAPWNAVFPGVALTLTVFSFNLVGDALRDVLDPRLRN